MRVAGFAGFAIACLSALALLLTARGKRSRKHRSLAPEFWRTVIFDTSSTLFLVVRTRNHRDKRLPGDFQGMFERLALYLSLHLALHREVKTDNCELFFSNSLLEKLLQ
jgi:hypothetical protein